jgi:hypothetical protein
VEIESDRNWVLWRRALQEFYASAIPYHVQLPGRERVSSQGEEMDAGTRRMQNVQKSCDD